MFVAFYVAIRLYNHLVAFVDSIHMISCKESALFWEDNKKISI